MCVTYVHMPRVKIDGEICRHEVQMPCYSDSNGNALYYCDAVKSKPLKLAVKIYQSKYFQDEYRCCKDIMMSLRN